MWLAKGYLAAVAAGFGGARRLKADSGHIQAAAMSFGSRIRL